MLGSHDAHSPANIASEVLLMAKCVVQEKVDAGESWLQQLKTREYDDLSFEQRVNVLRTLAHLALDGPTVRASLEGRIEEAQRIRKQMWEEAKVRIQCFFISNGSLQGGLIHVRNCCT